MGKLSLFGYNFLKTFFKQVSIIIVYEQKGIK